MFKIFHKKHTINLVAPVSGQLMDMTEVPDLVFSQKMIGDGVAIEPTDGLVVAPCSGTVTQIFSANHALTITTKEGLMVLIHLGLNTVELKGEGFIRLVKVNEEVKPGMPLMQMDLKKIEDSGRSTITPVIILNAERMEDIVKEIGKVTAGKSKIMYVRMKGK